MAQKTPEQIRAQQRQRPKSPFAEPQSRALALPFATPAETTSLPQALSKFASGIKPATIFENLEAFQTERTNRAPSQIGPALLNLFASGNPQVRPILQLAGAAIPGFGEFLNPKQAKERQKQEQQDKLGRIFARVGDDIKISGDAREIYLQQLKAGDLKGASATLKAFNDAKESQASLESIEKQKPSAQKRIDDLGDKETKGSIQAAMDAAQSPADFKLVMSAIKAAETTERLVGKDIAIERRSQRRETRARRADIFKQEERTEKRTRRAEEKKALNKIKTLGKDLRGNDRVLLQNARTPEQAERILRNATPKPKTSAGLLKAHLDGKLNALDEDARVSYFVGVGVPERRAKDMSDAFEEQFLEDKPSTGFFGFFADQQLKPIPQPAGTGPLTSTEESRRKELEQKANRP